MSDPDGPWPLFRRTTERGSHEEYASAARLRGGVLEIRELKHWFRYAWHWFAAAFLLSLLVGTAFDHELVFLASFGACIGVAVYRSFPAALADVAERIAETPESDLFDGSIVRVPLDEATQVRRHTPFLTVRYTGVRFEYNGNDYLLVGTEDVIGRLLDAFEAAGTAVGGERAASPSGRSTGKRPVSEDALRRK